MRPWEEEWMPKHSDSNVRIIQTFSNGKVFVAVGALMSSVNQTQQDGGGIEEYVPRQLVGSHEYRLL